MLDEVFQKLYVAMESSTDLSEAVETAVESLDAVADPDILDSLLTSLEAVNNALYAVRKDLEDLEESLDPDFLED